MEEKSNWCGFKFVADNIDKNINPRFQRHEHRVKSLHHFHGYALRDRVDFSTLSDVAPAPQMPDSSTFLPSEEDISRLKDELTVLISRYVNIIIGRIGASTFIQYDILLYRILVQHMEEFKDQKKSIVIHIPSKYSVEMTSKSEVVCVNYNY